MAWIYVSRLTASRRRLRFGSAVASGLPLNEMRYRRSRAMLKVPGTCPLFLVPRVLTRALESACYKTKAIQFKTIAETAPSRNVWFARTLAIDCTYPRAGGKVGQTFFKKFLISKCINSGSLLRIKLIACALSDSCEVNEVSDLMNWRTMKFLSLPDSIRVRVSQCCVLL